MTAIELGMLSEGRFATGIDQFVKASIGALGDSCNSLQQMTQRRERNACRVTMTANREGGTCALLMQYLNEWIPLIGSFRAGTYTLQVNGAHVEFHLINHANGFRIEPDPGPLPSSPPMP